MLKIVVGILSRNIAKDFMSGIHVTNTTAVRIQRCDVTHTQVPIWLVKATESEIDHCTVHGNNHGISLWKGASRNRIHHNTVRDQDGTHEGILILEQCNQNEIYANVCSKNLTGIFIDVSDGNVVRDNTTNENVLGGIWVQRGANNVVRRNTVLRNGTPSFVKFGILLGLPKAFNGPLYATGTLVEDNTALDNAGADPAMGPYQIDLFDTSLWDKTVCENTWRNNTFVKDNEKNADYGPNAGCVR